MTTPRRIRSQVLSTLFGTAGLLVCASAMAPAPANAGTVKGTVRLPDPSKVGRMNPGYWRLENGNVPVKAQSGKPTAAVVLDGISGMHAPPAKTVTVEIAGLEA